MGTVISGRTVSITITDQTTNAQRSATVTTAANGAFAYTQFTAAADRSFIVSAQVVDATIPAAIANIPAATTTSSEVGLQSVSAGSVTSTTARLVGRVGLPIGSTRTIYFRYRQGTVGAWQSGGSASVSSTTGFAEVAIRGLQSGVSYTAQGSADPAFPGGSVRSTVFTTQRAVVLPSVTGINVTNIRTTGAVVTVSVANGRPGDRVQLRGTGFTSRSTALVLGTVQFAQFSLFGLPSDSTINLTADIVDVLDTPFRASFMTSAPAVVVREASFRSFTVVPTIGGALLGATVDLGSHSAEDLRVRWSVGVTFNDVLRNFGSSAVSSTGNVSGSLSGLTQNSRRIVVASLVRGDRTVDTEEREVTILSTPPSISFDFGGAGATNFRMSYTGVTSVSVEIDIKDFADVDHRRTGLFPVLTYSHVATRKKLAIQALEYGAIEGMRVSASGPGGTITITYNTGGTRNDLNKQFFASRGWSPGAGTQINISRTFGPGTYT